MAKEKKIKPHDCPEKKWIDEIYRPWYEKQRQKDGDVETDDEGTNPTPPPPPPPGGH